MQQIQPPRPPATLTSLPPELLHQILLPLAYPDLLRTSLTHPSLTATSQALLWAEVEFYTLSSLQLALASPSCGRFQGRSAIFAGSMGAEEEQEEFASGLRECVRRVEGWRDLAVIGVDGLGVDFFAEPNLSTLRRLRIGANLLPSATPIVPSFKLHALHFFRNFDLSHALPILLAPKHVPPRLTTFLPSPNRPLDPCRDALLIHLPIAAPHLTSLTLSFMLDCTPFLIELLEKCTKIERLELAYVDSLGDVLSALPEQGTLRELALRNLARFEPPSVGLRALRNSLGLKQMKRLESVRLVGLGAIGVRGDPEWREEWSAVRKEAGERSISVELLEVEVR